MSWLHHFKSQRQQIEDLLGSHRYREALELTRSVDGEVGEIAELQISYLAAEHWLADAERACVQGDRDRMNAAMAEAARFYQDDLGGMFRETRRRIRQHAVELTTAPHWLDLLKTIELHQREFSGSPVPKSYLAFRNRRLAKDLTTEQVEGARAEALDQYRARIATAYPDTFHAWIQSADTRFLRAVLFVSVGRPDLALLPLLQLSDTEPLVCLERARVAYALGSPSTTMLALADFAVHNNGHMTIRRLNTGVFMAQMAKACGQQHRAVEILEGLPLHELGRRPVFLLAQLLNDTDRSAEGRSVLAQWILEHPNDPEAEQLLAQLTDVPPPTLASPP